MIHECEECKKNNYKIEQDKNYNNKWYGCGTNWGDIGIYVLYCPYCGEKLPCKE